MYQVTTTKVENYFQLVKTDAEWDMIEEVINTLLADEEAEDEE